MEAELANPASLSARFGTGELPLHSDTAHWIKPARYVALACSEEGNDPAPTYLLDTNDKFFSANELELFSRGVFHVRNGKNSFYTSVKSLFRPYFRYDPGCMYPMDKVSSEAIQVIDSKRRFASPISWRAGSILILDNWRTLHGRGASRMVANGRKLLRGMAA